MTPSIRVSIGTARARLAGDLAAAATPADVVAAVLAALDAVAGAIRGRDRERPSPEALGCARGATVLAEAAAIAWPTAPPAPLPTVAGPEPAREVESIPLFPDRPP